MARFDFRAHGKSGGSNEHLRIQGLRDDADAVADFAQAELGEELPLVALGVSFGGAPAVHLAATRPQAVGLVLWYAVIDYNWNFGVDARVDGTVMMRRATDPSDPSWSEFPVLGTPYHLPRALLREARADPTPRTLHELNLPLLNYQGSRDSLVDPTPLRAIAAGHTGWTLRTAHGAGHGFIVWRPLVIWHTVRWSLRLARRAHAVRPPSTTST